MASATPDPIIKCPNPNCGEYYAYKRYRGVCPGCNTPYKSAERIARYQRSRAKEETKRQIRELRLIKCPKCHRQVKKLSRHGVCAFCEAEARATRIKTIQTGLETTRDFVWRPTLEVGRGIRGAGRKVIGWNRRRTAEARERREERGEERGRVREKYPEFYRKFPRQNPVLSFFIVLILIYILFIVIKLAQTGDLQKYLTGTEIIAEERVPAAGKTFLYYLVHPDKYIEDKFSWTTGAENVEEEEKGIIIESLQSRRTLFKEGDPVEVLGYVEIKKFDEKSLNLDFLCKMRDGPDGKVSVEGIEESQKTIYPGDSGTTFSVLCSFENVQLKPEDTEQVTKKVTLEAIYNVETKGSLKIFTLGKDEQYKLRGENPFTVLTQLPKELRTDRTMRSTYEGGPLEFSILSRDRQPFSEGRYPFTLRLRNLQTFWGGEIQSIDRLELSSTQGITILGCDDFEEESKDILEASISDLEKINQKISKSTVLEFDKNNIEFACNMDVNSASTNLIEEGVYARLGYKYKLEKSATATIEKSKDKAKEEIKENSTEESALSEGTEEGKTF